MFNCIKLEQSSFPFLLLPALRYHKLQKFPKKSCFHFLKHHRLKAWKTWWKLWVKQSRVNICTAILKCISRDWKNVSSGLCRPDLGVLFPWLTWGSAGVITHFSNVLRAMAWKGTGVHKHSSIFFPANLLHETGIYFPLWISQQTKTIVTVEETMKNRIWQFQQSSARKKEIQ